MLSCDTFALAKNYFETGKNFFAKNSDRPLGESQPIPFFPGGTHTPGETVRCTHLTVPQAAKTYTVLGSRPYWIWGFEMGVNEFGLIIGNEAEGSRCDAESEEGLLGMDLLCLIADMKILFYWSIERKSGCWKLLAGNGWQRKLTTGQQYPIVTASAPIMIYVLHS